MAKLSVLSPELENLTDAKIETYLTADVRPVFPSVLAVAKVVAPYDWSYYGRSEDTSRLNLEILRGGEAEGWRSMTALRANGLRPLLNQVHFINPLLTGHKLTLKSLRDAAALVHAPVLLVYMEVNDHDEGYNDAAIAYWSIVGLFTVPGNTVGHCSVCQAVLMDTRSGFILATAEGESIREENVLPGAVNIAGPRTEKQAKAEAVAKLHANVRQTLLDLAQTRGKWTRQSPG